MAILGKGKNSDPDRENDWPRQDSTEERTQAPPAATPPPPVVPGANPDDYVAPADLPEGQRPPQSREEEVEQGSGFAQVLAAQNEAQTEGDVAVGGEDGGKDGVPGIRLGGPPEEEAGTIHDLRVPVTLDPYPYAEGDSRVGENPLNQLGFTGTDPIYQDPNSDSRTPAPIEDPNSSTMDAREDVDTGLVPTPSVVGQDQDNNAGKNQNDAF